MSWRDIEPPVCPLDPIQCLCYSKRKRRWRTRGSFRLEARRCGESLVFGPLCVQPGLWGVFTEPRYPAATASFFHALS